MKSYHDKKIKTAIDLLGTSILYFFAALIAFLLINLLEFLNLECFLGD
jgi:hypothetical protein